MIKTSTRILQQDVSVFTEKSILKFMCAGGFKFLHHTCVIAYLDHDWKSSSPYTSNSDLPDPAGKINDAGNVRSTSWLCWDWMSNLKLLCGDNIVLMIWLGLSTKHARPGKYHVLDYLVLLLQMKLGTVPAPLRSFEKRSAAATQTLQTMPPTKNAHSCGVLWFLRKTMKPQQIKHELKIILNYYTISASMRQRSNT